MFLKRLLASSAILVTVVLAVALILADSRAAKAADGASDIHGFDVKNLDKTCKPCEDFFQFANGGWIKNNPIPADQSVWGSFVTLADRNETSLRGLLESAEANDSAAPGSKEQKIGDFYASCMDTTSIEAQGVKPLQADLAVIQAIHDTAGLLDTGAHLQTIGVDVLFAFGSDQDFKDSTKVIGEATQGGLGLPERDYYLRQDEASKKIRDQYVHHAEKMLILLGDTPEKATAEVQSVMAIETALAKASMTPVELRDPQAVYHKMNLAEAQSLTPNISWEAYFHSAGVPKLPEINIGQPEFFKTLNAMFASVSLDEWKSYFRWHLVHRLAAALPDTFLQENFDFYGHILQGAKEIQPRWKRCTQSVDNNVGEALGQVYVQKYFPPQAKARALEMVHNLIAALHDDLQTLPWMSQQTRDAAITKLQAFNVKIGYPDKWRDYSALAIDRSSYVGNVERAAEFETNRQNAKIGKPVDHTEWGMTPPTVDAYNNPQLNEIVFPAGILQPPFFDADRDDAYNYGGMGAVIGHEITHGFDDQGAQFDKTGNLRNWWTPEDLKNFQQRGDCVAKQFDGYTVDGDIHQNGKLVEGESIADLGGVKIAYAAYQKSLEGKPREKDVNGFTPEQRFFLGYAQNWALTERPELARLQANTDPHPLPKNRAIGPLSNMPEFAKAWGCAKGDKMIREQVCKIW
jgi:putative endopeptidase